MARLPNPPEDKRVKDRRIRKTFDVWCQDGDLSELAEEDRDEGFWDTLVTYGPVLEQAIEQGIVKITPCVIPGSHGVKKDRQDSQG